MECVWKANWPEAKQHFIDWWDHKGLVLWAGCAAKRSVLCEKVKDPGPAPSIEASFTDTDWRARHNHHVLACHTYRADTLPIADTMIGPGSLALVLGAEPGFSKETVWFKPTLMGIENPEKLPPFRFDPDNKWFKIMETTARTSATLGRGKYLVGCPDLVENVDILAALRDPQQLMIDLVERPEWVEQKVLEINQVWFEVYQRIYNLIRLPDASSAFACFGLWGPGKTAKLQCDASAMFSPDMFQRFVVPALSAQCEWLDHSMYHLDGTQALCHLDALLGIEALDAIEWTPQAGIEGGTSPRWYDLYRKILAAGKSVQVVHADPKEIVPLLDAVGGKGVFILTGVKTEAEVDALVRSVEPYR